MASARIPSTSKINVHLSQRIFQRIMLLAVEGKYSMRVQSIQSMFPKKVLWKKSSLIRFKRAWVCLPKILMTSSLN